MLPPRYLLRESEILNILKHYPTGKFLEIGYGDGDLLVLLSKSGFSGLGYDLSKVSYSTTIDKLKKENITNVKLSPNLPEAESFDFIFMFEVIGYISNPAEYLSKISTLLKKDGILIFSFTNKKHYSKAEILTGDMKCFTKNEMTKLLNEANIECDLIWNYGYPLSNIIKPLTSIYYMFQSENSACKAIEKSGHRSINLISLLTSIILNRYTLYPFSYIQKFFRESDLGTGYIVVAKVNRKK